MGAKRKVKTKELEGELSGVAYSQGPEKTWKPGKEGTREAEPKAGAVN